MAKAIRIQSRTLSVRWISKVPELQAFLDSGLGSGRGDGQAEGGRFIRKVDLLLWSWVELKAMQKCRRVTPRVVDEIEPRPGR